MEKLLILCFHQLAGPTVHLPGSTVHCTSLLSKQHDVIASFSFGAGAVQIFFFERSSSEFLVAYYCINLVYFRSKCF